MNVSPMRQPSAWLPIAMSLAAIGVILLHIVRFGVARQADEGTSAHLFQLLMAGQAPIILFFAAKWLPQEPTQTLRVIAWQIVAALAAFAPVYWFGW